MISKRLAVSTLSILLAVSACSGDDPEPAKKQTEKPEPKPIEIPAGTSPLLADPCDPLVPTSCSLPWPSNVHLRKASDDATQPTLTFHPESLPVFDDRNVDAKILAHFDGFSTGTAAIAHFPGASNEGLANPDTIASSLAADSPTVLFDAATGERVPHIVDLDFSTDSDGTDGFDDERAIMIRPATRLKNSTRYIVAFRNVKHRDGGLVEPSPAFKALRDGTEFDHPSVELRRDLYKDIFRRLEAAGVERSDLQLAWDFTTVSDESTTADIVSIRDQALAAVGSDGPTFVVKEVEENPNEHILRRITLTLTLPLFLTSGEDHEDGGVGARVFRDKDGNPAQNGTMEADIFVHVPRSTLRPVKHGVLQNGHGLFGSKGEGKDGYLARMANDYKWIAISMNLFGFAGEDVGLAIEALSKRPELVQTFVDRQYQGHINQLLAMRMMLGRVAREGIRAADGTVLLDGARIDPNLAAYRGDSQGGIMGAVYMALSTDVKRGLLGETGAPYSLLLPRSTDWPGYALFLNGATKNAIDVQVMLSIIQQFWDRSEPNGYAHRVTNRPLPNTPKHRVLMHVALGDHQVTTYGAHYLSRAMGAVNLASDDGKLIRDVWGLESKSGPLSSGSALVEYDFNLKPEPLTNEPARDGCDPHDRVRVLGPSYGQQDHFFRTGEIKWFCDGVCNCDGPNEEAGCELTRCE